MKLEVKSLVTGGAGFIGSHLVDRLIALGHKVTVVDDFSLGNKANLVQHKGSANLKIYKKSICDDLSSIFKKEKFDLVFHLAAIPRVQYSIDYPIQSNEANISGTLNLLKLSKAFGVKRFIFSSSSSIYGDQKQAVLTEDLMPNPMSPYALHKLTGEYYCKLFYKIYGLETISLRYFNVFGPRQDPHSQYSNLIPKFFKFAIEALAPKINGDGQQKRDFTFVADVVSANVLAGGIKNKNCLGFFFNIGSGRNFSVNEVSDKILSLAGSKVRPVHGPAFIEPRQTLAGLDKSKKFLGWSPKYSLDKGLKLVYESLKNL